MNTSLERHGRLRPENIDPHHFTVSLLNEGLRSGALTPAQLERIQAQLMSLLSEAITRYTRGESSSVRTETAQGILQSLLYSIDICLREMPAPEQAMEALQGGGLAQTHARGQEIALSYVEQARQLLREVRDTRLSVYLAAYSDTIDGGIDDFFEHYDVRFGVHDTTASIDYPLLSDDMSWTGVVYIKRYLESLKLENMLCACYKPADIGALLKGCGLKYRMDGPELLVNACELILKNALCSVLVGRGADDLTIGRADIDLLESRLRRLEERRLPELLQRAMRVVLQQLGIDDPASERYFLPFADAFYPEFVTAFRENALAGLFVTAREGSTSSRYYFEAGKQLGDEQLRAVIDRIRGCRDGERKADIIESEIHSVEDLVEVFGSFSLFGGEYTAVFDRMGDHELAALLSGLLEEEPLAAGPALADARWRFDDSEPGWRDELLNYLQAGDPDRSKRVSRLAGEIRNI